MRRRCYDYLAMLTLPVFDNDRAEGHHVRSFPAKCNQSHASSCCENKQLDFHCNMVTSDQSVSFLCGSSALSFFAVNSLPYQLVSN